LDDGTGANLNHLPINRKFKHHSPNTTLTNTQCDRSRDESFQAGGGGGANPTNIVVNFITY